MPILAGIVAVFAIAAAWRIGVNAGNETWLPIVLCCIVAVVVATAVWHRRRMAEIHEKYLVVTGRWRHANMLKPWPKWCIYCGQEVHQWPQARAHDEPETSPCARYLAQREQLEREANPVDSLPMAGFSAEVLGGPEPPAGEPPPLPADHLEQLER